MKPDKITGLDDNDIAIDIWKANSSVSSSIALFRRGKYLFDKKATV